MLISAKISNSMFSSESAIFAGLAEGSIFTSDHNLYQQRSTLSTFLLAPLPKHGMVHMFSINYFIHL